MKMKIRHKDRLIRGFVTLVSTQFRRISSQKSKFTTKTGYLKDSSRWYRHDPRGFLRENQNSGQGSVNLMIRHVGIRFDPEGFFREKQNSVQGTLN